MRRSMRMMRLVSWGDSHLKGQLNGSLGVGCGHHPSAAAVDHRSVEIYGRINYLPILLLTC